MDDFTAAFCECLFWSEGDGFGGFRFIDLAPEALKKITEDCVLFQEQAKDFLSEEAGLYDSEEELMKAAGHDFCLTRNQHGSGFWDGDWAIRGDELSALAEKFETMNLEIGVGGKVYVY